MENIVWIVTVLIIKDGLHSLQVPKVFEDYSEANKYQDEINQNPIYKNINAFCFVEPAIWVGI